MPSSFYISYGHVIGKKSTKKSQLFLHLLQVGSILCEKFCFDSVGKLIDVARSDHLDLKKWTLKHI